MESLLGDYLFVFSFRVKLTEFIKLTRNYRIL